MKTLGQLAYEADVRRRPKYPDSSPRKTWEQLGWVERWSWERNPTPHFTNETDERNGNDNTR